MKNKKIPYGETDRQNFFFQFSKFFLIEKLMMDYITNELEC